MTQQHPAAAPALLTTAELEHRLRAALAPTSLEVLDESAGQA